MHSESNTIGAALLANAAVAAVVGTKVYQEEPPAKAAFPCLAYSESQTPAAAADNAIIASTVTVDIDVFAAASAWSLAEKVTAAMSGIGYLCNRAQSAGMVGEGTTHQVSMTFTTLKEV